MGVCRAVRAHRQRRPPNPKERNHHDRPCPTAHRPPRAEIVRSALRSTHWQEFTNGAKRNGRQRETMAATTHSATSDFAPRDDRADVPIKATEATPRTSTDRKSPCDPAASSAPQYLGIEHPTPYTRRKKTRQANRAGFLIEMPCGLRRSRAIRSSVRT